MIGRGRRWGRQRHGVVGSLFMRSSGRLTQPHDGIASMMGARVLVSRAVRVARRTRQPSLRCVLVCCSASAGVLYVSRRGGMHQKTSARRLGRVAIRSCLLVFYGPLAHVNNSIFATKAPYNRPSLCSRYFWTRLNTRPQLEAVCFWRKTRVKQHSKCPEHTAVRAQ